jgi:hypothetical protein
VRLHRWRLDRELANGCDCNSSEDRAIRARQLARPGVRHDLARSLRRVVADAERPSLTWPAPAVPIRREAIINWRGGLLGLADRLDQPVDLNPRGVARVLTLITDATGPLYSGASKRSLGDFVWWAADGLGQCPPHDWRCPVIMKIDPSHVAWTCARCGATAVSDDTAVRPA